MPPMRAEHARGRVFHLGVESDDFDPDNFGVQGANDSIDSVDSVRSPHVRARRAESPPPPKMPEVPVSAPTEDAEVLACSIFSYSYSQSTSQIVYSRLASMLRSLERLRLGPTMAAASASYTNLALLGQQAREAVAPNIWQASANPDPQLLDNYISVIREALIEPGQDPPAVCVIPESASSAGGHTGQRSGSRSGSGSASRSTSAGPSRGYGAGGQGQRLSMPICNFRRESASWLKSVSRILPEGEPPGPKPTNSVVLLELLSTPCIDISRNIKDRPAMLRRKSSMVSLPLLKGTPGHPHASRPASEAETTCDPTPLVHIPSKYSSRHAVFTTSADQPFDILSLNDMACLMFGTSQKDGHGRSLLDFIDPLNRAAVLAEVAFRPPGVCLTGRLVDISKDNNTSGLASLWVEKSPRFIVWVIEEVVAEVAKFEDGKLAIKTENSLFKDLSPSDFPDLMAKSKDDLHYYAITYNGINVPVLASYHDNNQLRLRAPPVIAGAVILDNRMEIRSYNVSAIHNLLGMNLELVGQNIDALIPKFNVYLREIERLCNLVLVPGTVIPEHLFRQVACKNADDYFEDYPKHGVTALNRDGKELFVDIQLRILSPTTYVLWLSYSRRPYEPNGCVIPSQMDLLKVTRRRTKALSTTSSSDEVSPPTSTASTPLTSPRAGKPSSPLAKINVPLLVLPPTRPVFTNKVGAHRRELKFSDFDVIRSLGEGAYGQVFLVKSKKEPDAPEVALKSIAKDRILVDTWCRDRQLGTIPNEIKVMNLLRANWHPNIVELVDFFEDDKCYHVEMMRHGNPGVDLFDLIEARPDMTEAECQSIFRQVASAIAHLHSLGIVHRDIKDENIISDEHGLVKLIDFGSAAFTRKGPFDVFVGTVDYAAPEVLEGMPYEGPQQDVWALGILLYTLVYKENPFRNIEEITAAAIRIPFDVSVACTDLLNAILVRDYHSRPTAEWIVNHEWLKLDSAGGTPPQQT